MQARVKNSITGPIALNIHGKRANFSINVIKREKSGFEKVKISTKSVLQKFINFHDIIENYRDISHENPEANFRSFVRTFFICNRFYTNSCLIIILGYF